MDMATTGSSGPSQVAALRRQVWGDGRVSPEEDYALFEANDRAVPGDADWADFFVEAVVDYCLSRGEPRGFVTESDAAWLIGRIDANGVVESHAELEMLVKLLERAANVPESLKLYGLAQIEAAALTGSGPTRRGAGLDPGSISEAEVALLRRILFAAGGDTPARVGRGEAEALFRIKDATLGAANAPGWKTLFVQAVANHLLTDTRAPQPDRATAVRLERFMDDHRSSVAGFFGRMLETRPTFDDAKAAAGIAQQAQRSLAAGDGGYTADERGWTEAQLGRDGAVDELEQALLDFIKAEVGAS